MGMNFWIAQILGTIASLINVGAMQLNQKKQIMISYIVANFLHATTLALLGGYSGAVINIVAAFQTLINHFLDCKQKKTPIWLVIIYLIASVALASLTVSKVIDVIPILCAILYIMLITVQKEATIRKFSLANVVLWVIYDIIVKNYSVALFDFMMIVSTLIGMYRYDFKKEKREGEFG